MAKVSIDQLAMDVAAVLGESLALDCHPAESPFPGIGDQVRILAPGALASLTSHPTDLVPYPTVGPDGMLGVRDSLYPRLVKELARLISS